MAQNIYDNPEFFKVYRELRDSSAAQGLMGGALTHQDLAGILPSPRDCSILDLGCGDGWFSRWAITQGASRTHGVDLSQSQVGLAKKAVGQDKLDAVMTFEIADLDTVVLAPNAYELAFSSLAVHYVQDLRGLLAKVYAAIKPGGHFYFSTEHPIYTAPLHRQVCQPPGEEVHWRLNHYPQEGRRTHFWLGKDVEKNHWTMGTYINAVLAAGFELVYFHEWGRPGDGTFGGSSWWMTEDMGPTFLMLGGRKKKAAQE